MKKVVFISHIGYKKNVPPNGVNVKNAHILRYLSEIDRIRVRLVDTDNWKFRVIPLFFQIFIYSFLSDRIILSINTKSAYQVIKFLNFFKLNRKLIYFVVGGVLQDWISEGKVSKKYYLNISRIYVETETMRTKLQELGCRNVKRLPNMKYFDDLVPNPGKITGDPIKCFYLGRILSEKGIDLIFESLHRINQDRTRYTVDFFGPIVKDYVKEFEKQAASCEGTRYLGTLDLINDSNGYSLLSSYDLFLFPTYWPGEGFPGAVLDSFISGVPVLASDWNHNREIVQDGYNGLICSAKNADALYEKLAFIMENKEILPWMGRNAQITAKNYKAENVLRALASELEE